MCGACGRAVARDAWSPQLSSARARWQAARVLDAFLRETGHPARVTSTGAAWSVGGATGRTVLAQTATQLWDAVRAVREVPEERLEQLAACARSPEARALVDAARGGGASSDAGCA
ncbi:hypothetical protein [Quadrisphaera sp. DSM 44207]|uniref:hypothetical protein n=1 Tax=Quadrisphaera sp. DSM 44207 TaxID=1881057 RepID=UPI0008846C72|nr:hypothetical protein [Quadrisphaera sp. DSM 44207]SDQ12578.1 hypothetical protein SAMN05428996_0670 [Quadrisphaera sp. DSM 44207]